MTVSACGLAVSLRSTAQPDESLFETDKVISTKRGKGRVKARYGHSNSSSLAVGGASDALQEAQHGERKTFPKARFAAWLKSGWVQAAQLDPTAALQQAHLLMQSGVPLKCNISVIQAQDDWTLKHLAAVMGQQHCQWSVLCSGHQRNVFLRAQSSKNIFGSMYHVRELATQHLHMGFWEYAQCAANWTTKKALFWNTIMQQPAGQQSLTPIPCPESGLPPRMQQMLLTSIAWTQLQDVQQLAQLGQVQSVSLVAGGCNALLPACYESQDRLIAQVNGCQRILLISPEWAFKGMYPYPVHHPYDGHSMVDLEVPDLEQWPHVQHVKGLCCILQPSQMLFVPAYWFVHAQLLKDSNVSLTFNMSRGARPRAVDCIPLQLSRHLEMRLADAEGLSDVRHWLQLLGYGEEHEWMDLATVQGYRRMVMCQDVRDELQLQLTCIPDPQKYYVSDQGAGEQHMEQWQLLLLAMCDGRLLPTHWLNKDFRERLYLTDTPVQCVDTQTAEERKYPQLFSHRQQEGWSAIGLQLLHDQAKPK